MMPRKRSELLPDLADRTTITAEEYRALVESQAQQQHKYRAAPTDYNGVRYASKLEASIAEVLDRLRADRSQTRRHVVTVERQPRFALVGGIVYVADFAVTWSDQRQTVIEVKGFETAVWKLKYKLMRACYPDVDLRVVTRPLDLVVIAEEVSR